MSTRAAGGEHVGLEADRIYDESIRPLVEPQLIGKIVAIDVDSGDYEVDEHIIPASRRLRARRPNGRFFARRVGADVVYSFSPSVDSSKR